MTPLQHEPSAHAPWMRTMFGRAFISEIPSSLWLVVTLTLPPSPAGRYPQRYCTSDMAIPRFGARPAVFVHGRREKPRAVRQNQVLLSERPVVAGSGEPVTSPGLATSAWQTAGYGRWWALAASPAGRPRGARPAAVARPGRDRRRVGWLAPAARPAVAGGRGGARPA